MADHFWQTAHIRRTKLGPPFQHQPLVKRPLVLDKALRANARHTVLVVAPAGYGKTSLLTQLFHALAAQENFAQAWLSLDPSDNDLVRFLRGMLAALDAGGIRIDSQSFSALEDSAHAPYDVVATAMINILSLIERPVCFFMDDCHVLNSQPVRRFLADVLVNPLENIRFIIGARQSTNLPVSRLRALGGLYEMGAQDLKFSAEETKNYFASREGGLYPEYAEMLTQRTEGWIAGIQLASLAMQTGESAAELINTLSGERRAIATFLTDEVFRRQPQDIQRFLLESSLLSHFDADLCNVVMDRNDSALLIGRIRDANIFLVGLDPQEQWFRFHHLFSQAMYRRLSNLEPERRQTLHLRACEALARRGLVTEAIEHALAADAPEHAGALLDSIAEQLFASGETETLRALARRLPKAILHRQSRLQLELAWDAEIAWDFTIADEMLASVRRLLGNSRPNRPEPTFDLKEISSRLVHREMMLAEFRDDLVLTRTLAHEWLLNHLVSNSFMQASLGTTLILCNRELDHCSVTLQGVYDIRRQMESAKATYGSVFHGSIGGSALLAKGDLTDAETILREALATAVTLHGTGSDLAAMPAMLLADTYYEQNKLDEIRELLEVYGGTTPKLGFADNAIASFMVQARVARLEGGYERADTLLRSGLAMAQRFGFGRMAAAILREQTRFPHRAAVAEQLMFPRESIRAACAGQFSISHAADLASAFLASRREKRVKAAELALIQQLQHAASQRSNLRVAIRLCVDLAATFQQAGQDGDSLHYASLAVQYSQQKGFARSILDAGDSVRSTLIRLADDGRNVDCAIGHRARQLLDMETRLAHPMDLARRASGNMSDSLVPRELEILSKARDSRTNADIAALLNLSENTVKWYWQRIFDKLHVRRRHDAIQKARNLNLL